MKTILLFALLILSGMATAQTIDNPTFKARTGSIHNITRIERTPEATKVFIHTIFRPNWWISEEGKSYLVDTATGIQYPFLKAEGIELNEKVFMPDSGEKDYVLYFAPLPKETKNIHYIDPSGTENNTYDLSLIPGKKEKTSPIESIKGNWYRVDIPNRWEYGIYDSISILHNRIFRNETIRKKGKSIEVIAKDKQNGSIATLLLTPQKNGNCLISINGANDLTYSQRTHSIKVASIHEEDFKPFFRKDTAYIQGYINGYDRRLGFETGLIYLSNEMTREDYPTVVTIHPNGSFEAKLPLNYPIEKYIAFEHITFPFYIEPGQTLTMYIDWESVLERQRARDYNYPIKNIAYMGPSAALCRLLDIVEAQTKYSYNNLTKIQHELTPNQFKEQIQSLFAGWDQKKDSLITQHDLSGKPVHLIKNKVALKKGSILFEFLMGRDFYARKDSTNQALKVKEDNSYYDFLKDIPLDDAAVLANDNVGTFINRFEFMAPLWKATIPASTEPMPDSISYTYPKKSLLTFLKEKGVELNPKQETLRLKQEEMAGKKVMMSTKEMTANFDITINFYHEQEELVKEYEKTYLGVKEIAPEEKEKRQINLTIKDWEPKAKYIRQLNANSNPFLWQVALVREAHSMLNRIQDRNNAQLYIDSLKTRLNHPILLEEVERMLETTHPEYAAGTYQLPNTKAAEIFRNIIKAHPGKVLFVDFWATFCGPCRSGIEATADLREKYRNHPEFQFIYITGEKDSPIKTYNEYVEKNLKGEASYRVSDTEFNYLRELFGFNGIPHYELVEKDGTISKQKIDTYRLRDYLGKRFGGNTQTLSK